jgi:TolA-binding protein
MRAASFWVAGLMAVSACGMLPRAQPIPDPRTEWADALAQADREALAGRFGVADRVLADFAERHPNMRESYDALFWRAFYKLDPTNGTATPREAQALLDTYLSISVSVPHRGAATTLRRIASALERPAQAAASSTSSGSNTPTPTPTTATDKSRDEEVARLRDELAKANAELERIKRRVATPKP